MGNCVVVGAQWGDEGKAKITDLLAHDADLIIRYQGGCNAGHTVVAQGKKYKFHLIPSGILYGNKICFIGAGAVVHPETLQTEIEGLLKDGHNLSNLKISPLASITMDYHIAIDGYSEDTTKEKIGTTKKGIGPTYSDKVARYGLKVQDLFDDELLSKRLDTILQIKNKELESVFNLPKYTKENLIAKCKIYKDIFAPYVAWNRQEILQDIKKEGKKVLLEGAQGVMLDIDYGTYPYVTSSNPIAGGAFTGSGYGPDMADENIGVFKAYITRVGEGPFMTELLNETGDKIRNIGAEFGTTTGRPRRCGWFDGVVAKYSVLVSGLTSIAVTKLDVFDNFDEIKFCVAYRDKRDGTVYKYYPTNINLHKHLEPVYETFAGWKQSISNAKTFDELPQNAKRYLKGMEEFLGIPVNIVSVGEDREQTIILKNPME